MFAYAATDAQLRIDVGLLQSDLNGYRTLGLRRRLEWKFTVYGQTAVCIGDDFSSLTVRATRYNAKIIPGGILVGNQGVGFKINPGRISRFYDQRLLKANNIVKLPSEDGLGTDRAIFLADNAGPIHRPGQTAAPIDKGGADFNGTLFGVSVKPLALRKADRPNRSCRTKIAAGNTIVLTATGADSKIEHRRPQAFQAGGQSGRMNYIGWTDAHTLTAFDTARQELIFGQTTRWSYQAGIPVGSRVAGDSQQRYGSGTGNSSR